MYNATSSGDQDSVVPLMSTRTLVNNLAASLQLNTTVPYSVWFQGKQVRFNINKIEFIIQAYNCSDDLT